MMSGVYCLLGDVRHLDLFAFSFQAFGGKHTVLTIDNVAVRIDYDGLTDTTLTDAVRKPGNMVAIDIAVKVVELELVQIRRGGDVNLCHCYFVK